MKENLRKEKGITLIALVITIIVLLILAGVSIAMLTGQNGILTQANNAKIQNSHGAVKDAIVLLYNEYQIQINTASTTKLASTEAVTIKGEEVKAKADTSMTFLDFLKGGNSSSINYIKGGTEETGYILDVEALTGGKQALGNGTGSDDVYKIEEENGSYVVKYYESSTKSEEIWNTSINTSSVETEPDWDTILAQATTPHPDQKESNDIGVGTDGKLVNLDLWNYEKTEDGKGWNLEGDYISATVYPSYMGKFTEGKIEGTVPQYIKEENGEFLEVTEMQDTFNGCTELLQAPKIPSGVIDMDSTFYGCGALEETPEIPSKVTNMSYTFYDCSKLKKAPEISSSVIDMSSTFYGCSALEEAPEIPSKVTNMSYTFYGCSKLKKAPEIPSSVIDMSSTFYGCSALTGMMFINANPSTYDKCFYETATSDNSNLILVGQSIILDALEDTKSTYSTISAIPHEYAANVKDYLSSKSEEDLEQLLMEKLGVDGNFDDCLSSLGMTKEEFENMYKKSGFTEKEFLVILLIEASIYN